MKYILLIIINLYFNTLFAQQPNTDSLFTSLLSSIENDTVQDSSRKSKIERDVEPLLDLHYQMQKHENELPRNFDLYNQVQMINDYSFTTISKEKTIPLTFSTYHLKQLERLEAIRKIIIPQRDAMLKYLHDGHSYDSPEIAAFRRYLGVLQGFTSLIILLKSLQ